MSLRSLKSICLVMLLAFAAMAAGLLDFNGSYTLTDIKGTGVKFDKNSVSTLNVHQTSTELEVKKDTDGKEVVSHFPLNGSEAVCSNAAGEQGKCKGHVSKKDMVLDSVFPSQLQLSRTSSGPVSAQVSVNVHATERWEISADLKRLTIHKEISVDSAVPGLVVDQQTPNRSWTEIYTRN